MWCLTESKRNMQGHFRAFKPSWSKALGRWRFAGAVQDFVLGKVFNYSPMLIVLRGCRHQFCVCLFSGEFSDSSLSSHSWKPLGPWFSSGWARQADLKVKKTNPLWVKPLWKNMLLTIFASTKGFIANQGTSLESWETDISLPRCLQHKLMSRKMRKVNWSVQV